MSAQHRSIRFRFIADAALPHAEMIVRRWLPDGRRYGDEWVVRNPKRPDRHIGSFKINLRTGCWGDFATGDVGGDLISLAAFLFNTNQTEAAFSIAFMLGISVYE